MTKELTLNKVAAGLLAVTMMAGLAFAFAAQRAHAITLSELVELFIALEVIPEDKADEARAVLQGQGEEEASMTCNFTRNLSVGTTGADVKDLQKLLNAKGFMVAASGAGSAGSETEYYGQLTANAVAAMQEAYASEVLAPLGLTAGTGYFGAATRAKANTLCAAAPSVPPLPGDEEEEEVVDEEEGLGGTEASLEDFKRLGSPSSVDVAENEDDTKVAGWEFEVKDGDASLRRVDIMFEATAGSAGFSYKPYEYFDSISLFLDGEKIAEEDADSKSDWSDLAGNVWKMRFSGLSEKLDEDSKLELVVAVTTKGNLDTNDEGTTWYAWVASNGVRARDASGIDQYIGDGDTRADADYERSFVTEGAGSDDELTLSLASSNPKSSIIKVDANNTTEDVTILVFEMKAEGNDITIDTLPITFTVPATEEFDDIITDVKIEVDGVSFNDYTTASSTTAGTATTTFDIDEDLVIDEDDKVTVKVIIDLNSQSGNYAAGSAISASVPSYGVDDITGTGGDDLSASTNKGSAVGETHQLLTEGIFAEIVSVDETKTAGDNNANDVGDYKIKFDLTAFEDTFYVSATSSAVFVYHVEDGSGSTVSTTTVAAVTSTATKEGNSYRINEGGTEEFTLTVTLNPQTTGYYRIELDSITYGTTAATPYGSSHTATPDEDFETDNLYLNA